MKNTAGVREPRFALSLMAVAAVLGFIGCSSKPDAAPPMPKSLDTEYQAVILTNGQVFFGKLQGLGTRYPMLDDVYYVRVYADPKVPAQSTSTLVKRGREWHAPDSMVINAEHIVLVEPVTKGSQVARLIAEEKQKGPPEKNP